MRTGASPADFIGPPCGCPACVQAVVNEHEQRRDPWTGKWLHGYDLKRWYEARERARAAYRASGPKGMK